METAMKSQAFIDQLVQATCGGNASKRQRHIFRESLNALVRLAKAEQMLEMRQDISRSVASGRIDLRIEPWKA